MMCQIRFVLFIGIAISVSVLFAQPSDRVRNPFADDPAAAIEGQGVFAAACQSCHGPAGQGDRERGTPALASPSLPHGNEDADLFATIRNGIAGTQMPPFRRLTDEQIWKIISYIRSLQGGGRDASSGRESSAAVAGDAGAGETVFFGKAGCANCDEVNARGGVTGPDLSDVARRLDAALLRRKIVAPDDPLPSPGGRGGAAAAPVTIVARLPDGRNVRGVRRNEDTYTVQIVDASGTLHLLEKARLSSLTVETRSLMPDDFARRLSDDEITNLVAYLHRRRERELGRTAAAAVSGGVDYNRLRRAEAEPHNWLMYWGDYHGTHQSPLNQINTSNVQRLKAAWAFPIPGNSVIEGTPLVVDGVMYATGSGNPATVTAIDARTGRQIWRWTRQQKTTNPFEINPFSRGVAILGNRLFVGTLDGVLIALDARTGQPLWEAQVADTMEGYSLTSPPLAINDKIIVGIAGGEYATRGFVDAYDAATGRRLWRFYTVPGPGDAGNETWKGDSWKTGGAAAWLTGTYDPDLNTVFWPVGNPAPQIDRSVRGELDNLYSDSVVALDPDSGRLKWHYQFTPNDGHDWDSVQDMMLVDRTWHGQQRRLLMHADRNGHFYVLDRSNGSFLSGTPFVYQNWNTGFDAKGRPQPVPGSNSSTEGSFLVYPTLGGATNFQAPSYSPLTGWLYLAYSEAGQQYVSAPAPIVRGQQYIGRGRASTPAAREAGQPAPSAGIKALDPETGKSMWDFKIFQGSITNGVLATGGGVLFVSTRDGNISALDMKTGAHLWHFQTGGNHAASPISYAVDGRQYLALSAGNAVFSFALPD